MQKSVYRGRTQAQIQARLALDMWREAHAEGRQQTLAALHRARAGQTRCLYYSLGVDWQSRQGYNVSVTAPFER